jgi:hypothetical protein
MRIAHLAAAFALLFCSTLVSAETALGGPDPVQDRDIEVYVYPHVLTPDDRLTDGRWGWPIPIKDNSLLVWVDMQPLADFAHHTEYVLISGETTVFRGQWTPVLNGKPILYGEPDRYAVLSPSEHQLIKEDREVSACIYPHVLTNDDLLTDGPEGQIRIADNSLLIWVDQAPGMRFVHPTEYILISASKGPRVLDGRWWPVLNKKRICYAEPNPLGVISPFIIP